SEPNRAYVLSPRVLRGPPLSLSERYAGTIEYDCTVGHSRSRTVVWLKKSQVNVLTRISKKSLAPVSALVRQAVEEFVQRQKRRERVLEINPHNCIPNSAEAVNRF